MLFFLKLQRDKRQHALSVAPAKGKTEKKAVFSTHCGDETPTYSNRAFLFLLSLSLSLHIFRRRALWLRAFIGYWRLKDSINHFLSYDIAFL